jgi:hypothetical protein
VEVSAPYRSLSHKEARGWVLVQKGKLSASLDGIYQRYEKDNPYLGGMSNLHEAVASLGYQATPHLKLSGDLSRGSTPVATNETRGLLRAEYRFGFGKKGGQ